MKQTIDILKAAKEAKASLCFLTTQKKNEALSAMADALLASEESILRANEQDVAAARAQLGVVMIDRLTLTEARIASMAEGIRALIDLPDPVGRVIDSYQRDDGLVIEKIGVPMVSFSLMMGNTPSSRSRVMVLRKFS